MADTSPGARARAAALKVVELGAAKLERRAARPRASFGSIAEAHHEAPRDARARRAPRVPADPNGRHEGNLGDVVVVPAVAWACGLSSG
jgi:hypothetical protein